MPGAAGACCPCLRLRGCCRPCSRAQPHIIPPPAHVLPAPTADTLKLQADAQAKATEQLTASVRMLEAKINEARNKKETLKARAASAKTSKAIQELVSWGSVHSDQVLVRCALPVSTPPAEALTHSRPSSWPCCAAGGRHAVKHGLQLCRF